jgi:hypothetical protein
MLALVMSALSFTAPIMNPCEGKKPKDAALTDAETGEVTTILENYFDNRNCAEMMDIGFNINVPQAGMDVTDDGEYGVNDYKGTFDPIIENYAYANPKLCPVNVHWHLGAEHRSEGQYDENGKGPHPYDEHGSDRDDFEDDNVDPYPSGQPINPEVRTNPDMRRSLAGGAKIRQGVLCHHYDAEDPMYTTPYDWQYCKDMEVGQTYEVHWPHSAAGACDTVFQYQYPFYDGVFCRDGIISFGAKPAFNAHRTVGVQGQVFTIVNSEDPMYQNDHLMDHAWMDESHWTDVAKYVGSTTGTSRDNVVCSMYSPITWQVDRKCHKVSAASFDLMCKEMLAVKAMGGDDMYPDTYPHGAREVVNDTWTESNVYRRD